MTSVQQDILMKLIEEYADLHRLKAQVEDEQYTYEWRYYVREDVERDMPIVKGKIEKILKGIL